MAYRGSVTRLPIGILGFSGSRNPTQLQAGHFEAVEGVALDGGLLQKEGGAAKLNPSNVLTSGCIVGFNYSPLADITRDVVLNGGGSIRKDDGTGAFATVMATGLNVDREPPGVFVMGGGEAVGSPRTLFFFSASNQVRAVDGDGAVMSAITTPPADWAGAGTFPTFGVLHEGRMWGGGNASDPHRIYFSTPGDHQNYTGVGSGSLSVYPGRGERLVGGVSFKGLLVLFKYPRGIYLVVTSDPAISGWRVEELSGAVGAVNQSSIVPIDNDVVYMDSGGNIHMLSATNAFGDTETGNIGQNSDIAEFMRSSANLTNIRRAVGVWDAVKDQAIFAFCGEQSADNDIRLHVDFSAPQVGVRYLISRRDQPVALWMRPDAFGVYKPVFGDIAGFVWLMDQEARNKDGAGYEMSFESSNMDFSWIDPRLATLNKTGDFLELVLEPQGDWDLIVTVVWDDVPGPPLLYSMGGDSAPLGTFTLGTHELGTTSIRSIRKRIAGSGRRLRLMVENNGEDENVAIADFLLSFRAMDERVRRNA